MLYLCSVWEIINLKIWARGTRPLSSYTTFIQIAGTGRKAVFASVIFDPEHEDCVDPKATGVRFPLVRLDTSLMQTTCPLRCSWLPGSHFSLQFFLKVIKTLDSSQFKLFIRMWGNGAERAAHCSKFKTFSILHSPTPPSACQHLSLWKCYCLCSTYFWHPLNVMEQIIIMGKLM